MKKFTLILALIIATTFMSACKDEETVSLHEIYPRTMTVTEINTESDVVTITDSVGYVWEFYGVEDWEIGDICSCIMHTNSTEIITDDEIITVRYNGNGGN